MKTRMHPHDYQVPRDVKRDYTLYICVTCGGHLLPSITEDHRGYCSSCKETVPLCGVPMDQTGEVRSEIRKATRDETKRNIKAVTMEPETTGQATDVVYGCSKLAPEIVDGVSMPSWWNNVTEEPF